MGVMNLSGIIGFNVYEITKASLVTISPLRNYLALKSMGDAGFEPTTPSV